MKNLFKILAVGLGISISFYFQALAATSGCCNSDCTCSFEIVNNELIMTAHGNNVQAHAQDSYGENSPWRHESYSKITIGDGITSIKSGTFYGHSVTEVNLPSTLKKIENRAFANSHIGKIEIPDSVTSIGSQVFSTGVDELILSSNSNYAITAGMFGSIYTGAAPKNYNVSCKGVYDICQNRVTNLKSYVQNDGAVNIDYYKGYDDNGNWVEYSEEGKAVYADSNKSKIIGKYDSNGVPTEVYQYDNGGNLISAYKNGVEIYRRKIYTPAEATAAVKNNKNTFSIKYR